MNFDISHLLDEWPYEPGRIVVRRFKTKAGAEKIQLRVDLGLLQMNAEGRPDGKRPFGRESFLQYQQSRLKRYLKAHPGDEDGFELTPEETVKLQQEAIQYHHRYICLFQLQDYAAVVRDTERNLKAFEFIARHAPGDDWGISFQHLVPQLLMLRTRAGGMIALEGDRFEEAMQITREGLESIRRFYTEHDRADMIEHSGEMESLQSFLGDIEAKRPLTKTEELQLALEDAVRREDYERAAQVRDLLRTLKTSG